MRSSLSRWLAAAAAGLLSVSAVAALLGVTTDPRPTSTVTAPDPAGVVPLFGTTEKAANEPALILQADDRGLSGWVAGNVKAADATVALRIGARKREVTVGADNTFRWEQSVNRNTPVTATLILPDRAEPLTARTTLLPAASPKGDTIFFITDRSAYRPGHTLKFVAFLRTLLPNGEFEAVRNRDVTVHLTSQTRGTRAARLKLKSDANGRVIGEYTFSDADALDHYSLTAAEFTGNGRVFLGEYRKSKVGLKLKGEVKDGKLAVTFDARDYLDRPVKGTAASYTASVIRNADAAKLTLNPDAFAKPEGGPPAADDFNALPDDERLLTLAHGVSAMTFAGFGSRFVASRAGTVPVAKDGAAKLDLDLHPEWLKGGYTVTVAGVFTDETGRENRATTTVALDPKSDRGITVTTPKELFATSEPITVSLAPFGLKDDEKPTTMVLVVRLEAAPASPWITPGFDVEDPEILLDNARIPALTTGKAKKAEPDVWKSVPVFDPVKRKIVVGLPVTDNSTEVKLKQPGAYKLVAVTRLADGTTLQSETGVVVKPPARLPGVVLALDRREIDSGSRLTGVVHTRFAGAKMLLTLRDAQGIKLTRPLTGGANGVAKIDEALPANLRYGCAVAVMYPENATMIHVDQRELFVIPNDRTIGVKTTVPREAGPGAEINLGIEIDRKEAVDLVVSVFDESLLGVSGDLSKNLRDYYLADARGQGRAARELAATRFGSIRVAELVKKGEELLTNQDTLAREPGLEQQLTGLSERWKENRVAMADIVTLVRLAGLEVYLAHPFYSGNSPIWRTPRNTTLADLLRWERRDIENRNQTVFISATVIGNTALIGTAYRGGKFEDGEPPDPWLGYRGNPFGHAFSGFGAFCGGFNCGGQLGIYGSLGQQFGFSGYGNFGFRGFGAQFGLGGIGGFQIGGGLGGLGGGFGGGGLQVGGGNFGYGGGNLGVVGAYSGAQGSFSNPGGQMGFSYGFNRDFGGSAPGGVGPLPGLGVGEEMVRRDFADSAFWTAKLRTDENGKATANFKLPDSLTGWRVQVSAVSAKLHVGTGTAKFKSTRAIMIWPMLPRTFTEGDTVRVFGTVHNLTDKEQDVKVHLKAENGAVLGDGEQTVKVPAKGSVPVYWTYRAGKKGFTDLLMTATSASGSDASLKKLPVTAAGIVERATTSGLVGKGNLTVTLPEDFDPARASVSVSVAPTLAADLADTLPYLVEYPYGCVEQTMSRFLPAIRVAQILRQYGLSTHKELEAKLPKVVEAGQKRLIELQQPDGGWAWQGNGQTHEMMTPYALFGLIAAEEAGYLCPNPRTIETGSERLKVYLNQMMQRWDETKDWDKNNPAVNDALFCLWVAAKRTKADDSNWWLGQPFWWWKRIEAATGTTAMSDYGHALALDLAVKKNERQLAGKLAAELRQRAKKSGDQVYWTTAGFSRWGDNTIEVTAMVMKALVAYNANDPLIPGVLAFFHATKRGDRWDSTKDTACVLYALCDYHAAVRAGAPATGLVKVSVNGSEPQEVKLDGPASKVVKFDGKSVKPGANTVTVTGAKSTFGALARVVVSYSRGRGADIPARDHGVAVERALSVRNADGEWSQLKSGATVPLGSYIKVRVTAKPAAATSINYTVLESPKPGGGETVPADDPRFRPGADAAGHVLREDREAFTAFHYEHAPEGFTAEYVVFAEFAGEFQVPPARVELMYKPTVGGHSDSFVLKVAEQK